MPGISRPSGVSYSLSASRACERIASTASGGCAWSSFATGPARAVVRSHHSSNDGASARDLDLGDLDVRRTRLLREPARGACRGPPSESGPGTPGGGKGPPSCAPRRRASRRARGCASRAPQTETDGPAPGPQDAADLRRARAGLRHEHQALATEHASYDASGSSMSSRSSISRGRRWPGHGPRLAPPRSPSSRVRRPRGRPRLSDPPAPPQQAPVRRDHRRARAPGRPAGARRSSSIVAVSRRPTAVDEVRVLLPARAPPRSTSCCESPSGPGRVDRRGLSVSAVRSPRSNLLVCLEQLDTLIV